MKMKIYHNCIYIFFALIFIKMLVLNLLTPLLADDLYTERSISLFDAIRREYECYYIWSGRSIVNFLTRIFLPFPKFIYDVTNTCMYIIMIHLMYKLANPLKRNLLTYLFIISSIWLFTIYYGQVILWLTGAIIYMWGLVFMLWFLLPYYMYITDKKVFGTKKTLSTIGMFILGIVAGWGMENTSGGMIMLAVLALLYCKIFRKKTKVWMYSGLLGSIIGFLLLILAPGNYARAQHFVDERSSFAILAGRFNTYTNVLKDELVLLVILFIIIITAHIIMVKDLQRIYISLAFFISSIVTIYAMVISPATDVGRTMFGATIFMIIACAHGLAGYSFDAAGPKIIVYSLVVIFSFYYMATLINTLHDLVKMKVVYNSRDYYINEQLKQGNRDVVLPYEMVYYPNTKWNAQYGIEDLGADKNDWINISYARHYGLDSIMIVTTNYDLLE